MGLNGKIDVTSSSISSSIGEFKNEMINMDKLFEKIETDTKNAKSYWQGSASDMTLSHIEEFSDIFEAIKKQNEKYVDFLNEVIEKYTDEDESEGQYISSGNQTFDTKSIK